MLHTTHFLAIIFFPLRHPSSLSSHHLRGERPIRHKYVHVQSVCCHPRCGAMPISHLPTWIIVLAISTSYALRLTGEVWYAQASSHLFG
ncbi:hypothetical protein EI94DRAFT_1740525 [Lactarius quietus]|nr:hypothetical protein EI94DRAFT_1740525 [Lactarius quietus]